MAKLVESFLMDGPLEARAFIPSTQIDIFPCARRGQNSADRNQPYDPEARLNTEHTNRLHTARNGFKDSFIENYDVDANWNVNVKFVLAGYYITIRNLSLAALARALGEDTNTIYAYLYLKDGISLEVPGYYTKILHRQTTIPTNTNYLDVSYSSNENTEATDYFTGVSFVKDIPQNGRTPNDYYLPLFSLSNAGWRPIQTSLLPKVEHDETPDSIKISGNFTVKHGDQISFQVTDTSTTLGPLTVPQLTVEGPTLVKHGDETAFLINTDGECTINSPVTVTKPAAFETQTVIKSLVVGEAAEGEVLPAGGVIRAKGKIEAPSVEATEFIAEEVKADKLIHNNNPVPVIAIEQEKVDSALWQLQITNVITNSKN